MDTIDTYEQDVSEGMGIEDYTLGRPNRSRQAPNSRLYQQGWDYAHAEACRIAGF